MLNWINIMKTYEGGSLALPLYLASKLEFCHGMSVRMEKFCQSLLHVLHLQHLCRIYLKATEQCLEGEGFIYNIRGKYHYAQHPCNVIFQCLQVNKCNVLSDMAGCRLDKQTLGMR